MSQKLKTTPKPSPKNTLFNYFSKPSSGSGKTPQSVEKSENKKTPMEVVDDDQENQKNNKNLMGKKLDFGELTKHFNRSL